MKKQILIYGGGFNPPHIGHKAMCLNAICAVRPNECWVMPSATRHDKGFNISDDHRKAMLEIFVGGLNMNTKVSPTKVVLNLDEIEKETSCTVETYNRLKKEHPDTEFHFLFGSDVISKIKDHWIEGRFLWDHLNFVFLERGGYPIDTGCLPLNSEILSFKIGSTSSTDIRKKIKISGPLMAYEQLDPLVYRYILDKGLYQK